MQITMKQLVQLASKLNDEQKAQFLKPFLERPPSNLALSYAKHLTAGLTEDELFELMQALQETVEDEEYWNFISKWRRSKKKVKRAKKSNFANAKSFS